MIRALVILIVYVLGPALVFIWAVKRYKSGIKPDFTEVVAVLFAIVLIVVLMFSYSGSINQDDEAELTDIVAEMAKRYSFPVQAKYKEGAAVFGVAYPRYLEIRVYGIETFEEQEKLAEVMAKLRRQIASKPIVLHFLREEIWEEKADGSRQPLRDKEVSLRKIRLE